MKNILAAIALASAAASAPAFAAETPAAPAPAPAYSTAETDIGTLLDNPAAKAILEKHVPGVVSNPQFDMARAMTLKQVQSFAPDQISDDVLVKIDADLKAIGQAK